MKFGSRVQIAAISGQQVVQDPHFGTDFDQSIGQVRADKAGSAGHQDM